MDNRKLTIENENDRKENNRKGQAISTDWFFAVALFIIMIMALIAMWNLYATRISKNVEYGDMQIASFQASDFLVKNALADFDRNLSEEKTGQFFNQSYESSAQLLNIRNYDYYVAITDPNGTVIMEKGGSPEGEGTTSTSVRRYVIYGGKKAILSFRIWK